MRSLPGKSMKRVLPVINKTANHLEKENKQLKELLREAWEELEHRAIVPELTDKIEDALREVRE